LNTIRVEPLPSCCHDGHSRHPDSIAPGEQLDGDKDDTQWSSKPDLQGATTIGVAAPESIVVVRIRMAPHEKTSMHDIPSARLVVWLTDAYLRDTHPDGRSDDIRRRVGDIDWVPIQRHAGENLAHEPLEFLAIVPKAGRAAQ
jgi:hypothetical protein